MQTLSVLTHNLCCGLKGNTAWDSYNSTWRVIHGRMDPKEIRAKVNLDEFFKHLKELNPDVVVLNEVLDDLYTDLLASVLTEAGYQHQFIGNSGHHRKPLLVSTVVATRLPAQLLAEPLSFPDVPGSGGGAVALELSEFGVMILGCHLAFRKQYIRTHSDELDDFYQEMKQTYSLILFAGDFNRTAAYWKKRTYFGREMASAVQKRTFPSFFPFYGLLALFFEEVVVGAVDTVYYKGPLKVIEQKIIKSRSDHKMAYVKFALLDLPLDLQ